MYQLKKISKVVYYKFNTNIKIAQDAGVFFFFGYCLLNTYKFQREFLETTCDTLKYALTQINEK